MLFIIVIAIICATLCYHGGWKDIVISAVIGFTLGIVLWFTVGCAIGYAAQTEKILIEEKTIYALNDTSEVSGSMFLWTGYVNESLVYRYVVDSDDGKRVEEVDSVYDVYIKEGDYEPRVEYYEYGFKNKLWLLIAFPDYKKVCMFYVPENTVTTDYNINLE